MKKKGLIISTVVMVVVLIASLTTATYAWFTSSQAVTIDTISLKVTSSAKVNIGVKNANLNNADPNAYSHYLYESVSVAGSGNVVSWAEGTEGMGATLSIPDLKIESAYGIGTSDLNDGWSSASNVHSATAITTGPYIIRAQGTSESKVDHTKVELADANKDYLNATIGMEANTSGIKGMYFKVAVSTNDARTILGTNAAIHIVVVVGGKTYDIQPFGTETNASDAAQTKYSTTKTSLTSATPIICKSYSNVAGSIKAGTNSNVVSTFYFWVKTTDSEFATGGKAIHDFQIYAYIDGADEDAVNEAVIGAAATIDIEFDGTADVTKLSDNTTAASSVVFINAATDVKVSA